MNPYDILEVSVGASPDEIRSAYHSLAKKWHPDRFSGAAKAEAEQRFRMLAEAYNMLKDRPAPEPAAPAAPVGSGPAPVPAAPIQLDVPDPRVAEAPAAGKTAEDWYQDAKAADQARAPERALAMVQYAIRMDKERAEYHALLGHLLEVLHGDERTKVRALETAIRLNPRDVESTILLAQTFQSLGMHARASRLWGIVRNLAPNHPIFSPVGGPADPGRGGSRSMGLGASLSLLRARVEQSISQLFKRG